MIKVEQAMMRDSGQIYMIEVKAQEFPYPTDVIHKYMMTSGKAAFIARIGDRGVGAALVTHSKEDNAVIIDHLSVHPLYRGVSVSKRLIEKLVDYALEISEDGLIVLRIVVPAYLIEDKEDPYNIENWLCKREFKAVKLLPNEIRRYNRDYDAYVFERAI